MLHFKGWTLPFTLKVLITSMSVSAFLFVSQTKKIDEEMSRLAYMYVTIHVVM